MIFKKSRKTMSERPDVSAANENPDNATASVQPTDQRSQDALSAASEAAAEHVIHDAEAEGREDISELTSQLIAARAEAADLRDKWLRLSADFDNFRKRTAKERLELIQFAGRTR
ncbi:MAG: nucleotide exchange factor GrpE [Flavobacteriales bacterium]|nr:nucleotide exchange factor GrpE [Flavobacteriales bacterium]